MILSTHEKLLAHKGAKVTCKIGGSQETNIHDARIQVEGDNIFICQNERDGVSAKDKLGYDYSWKISSYRYTYEFDKRDCTNIKLIEDEKETKPPVKKETYETIIRRDDGLEFKKGMIGTETIEEIKARRKTLLQDANKLTALLKKYDSITF